MPSDPPLRQVKFVSPDGRWESPLFEVFGASRGDDGDATRLVRTVRSLERLAELRAMPYVDYLQTPEWDAMREAALYVADYRCQVCNRDDETLDVHHRTYERIGQELLEDLFVLCRSCHGMYHRRLPIDE